MFHRKRRIHRPREPERASVTAARVPTGSQPHTANLAARMGRWSAAHWKTATFGWLAFVAIAFVIGQSAGLQTIDQNTSGPGESGRVNRLLDAGFKQPASESVLIESDRSTIDDPAFRAAVDTRSARWPPARSSSRSARRS